MKATYQIQYNDVAKCHVIAESYADAEKKFFKRMSENVAAYKIKSIVKLNEFIEPII